VLWVAVFDTNILISALLWPRGNPYECLAMARFRSIESVTCEEVLAEFQRKLETKFRQTPEQSRVALAEVRSLSRVVSITNALSVVPNDPKDNMVVECAVVGGATHIVTGDKRHLLPLGHYQNIAIVTAADFLTLVSQR
jgi:putative PIN family toxin of toxin-antitoxin system